MILRLVLLTLLVAGAAAAQETVRFAAFNASMSRPDDGALQTALNAGDDPQITKVAAIIAAVDPDVLLINEFDHGPGRDALFDGAYLGGAYPHRFIAPSNTGLATGLDLDNDGRVGTTGRAFGNDAFGFGTFPGQYGMLILSKHPLGTARTFQTFLWKDLPGARRPLNPDGTPFHDDAVWDILRLSSKSHWAVPVQIEATTIWALAAHPTPPVFDGPEDRNGLRNADEIRLLADIAGGATHLRDDAGLWGGLPDGAHFVVMGDMNADQADGDSVSGAMDPLLASGLTNTSVTPRAAGGAAAADRGVNPRHRGDPAEDTADFNDRGPGNLRVDYVLPSDTLGISDTGIFWPAPGEPGADLLDASDHRLVWVDVILP